VRGSCSSSLNQAAENASQHRQEGISGAATSIPPESLKSAFLLAHGFGWKQCCEKEEERQLQAMPVSIKRLLRIFVEDRGPLATLNDRQFPDIETLYIHQISRCFK
jgi:hypothetical protein